MQIHPLRWVSFQCKSTGSGDISVCFARMSLAENAARIAVQLMLNQVVTRSIHGSHADRSCKDGQRTDRIATHHPLPPGVFLYPPTQIFKEI